MKKTATTAKPSTAIAAGFPAKTSAASTKLADAVFPAPAKKSRDVAVPVNAETEAAKKPTRAKKAAAPAKPAAKKAVAARPPTVLAKSAKLLAADAKGVPGIKAKVNGGVKTTRTVPDNGATLPSHGATNVAELAKVLGDFPRGSTFEHTAGGIDIYNLRGTLVATVRKVEKPAKGAKKPAAK